MTQSGIPVTSFTVAVARRVKADAEPQTDFLDCVSWRQTAEFITRYFRKGAAICVEGTLQKRTWTDQQAVKRYTVEVIVDNAYFVDSKSEASAPARSQPMQYIPESYMPTPSTAPGTMELTDDDDLPF